jgi:hypothetical protein
VLRPTGGIDRNVRPAQNEPYAVFVPRACMAGAGKHNETRRGRSPAAASARSCLSGQATHTMLWRLRPSGVGRLRDWVFLNAAPRLRVDGLSVHPSKWSA